jgi:hypothetical protein
MDFHSQAYLDKQKNERQKCAGLDVYRKFLKPFVAQPNELETQAMFQSTTQNNISTQRQITKKLSTGHVINLTRSVLHIFIRLKLSSSAVKRIECSNVSMIILRETF